jgi:uncharacterized membrane protein YeiH
LTAAVTFIAARCWDAPARLLLVLDACGLALFTVVGTEKALTALAAPGVAVMLGVMTGVAGGIIRDVLTGEVPLVFRPLTYLYATAAFCGAITLVLLAPRMPSRLAAGSIAIAVTLALRLAAIRWRLRLPEFRTRKPL